MAGNQAALFSSIPPPEKAESPSWVAPFRVGFGGQVRGLHLTLSPGGMVLRLALAAPTAALLSTGRVLSNGLRGHQGLRRLAFDESQRYIRSTHTGLRAGAVRLWVHRLVSGFALERLSVDDEAEDGPWAFYAPDPRHSWETRAAFLEKIQALARIPIPDAWGDRVIEKILEQGIVDPCPQWDSSRFPQPPLLRIIVRPGEPEQWLLEVAREYEQS